MLNRPTRAVLKRIVGGVWFWRRLPAAVGGLRVLVSPSSHLRYLTSSVGSLHADLIGGIAKLVAPGESFWDIGANVGIATFAAAGRVGRGGYVLSVDGDTRLVDRLRIAAAANAASSDATVEVLPAAVSDAVGIVRFNLSSHSSATNAITGLGRFPGVAQVVSVPAVSLDWLLTQVRSPDVVKIDVEGAELMVLNGAATLLRDVRPTLIVEVGGEVADAVTELLSAAGYRLYRLSDLSPLIRAIDDVVALPPGRALPT